jgi:Flp pilus assembly protein TadD
LPQPERPEGACHLSTALAQLSRPREAIRTYRRALELDPNFVAAKNNLAQLEVAFSTKPAPVRP